jgi:HAD superfamily hydrolase (TIGR01484 family)
MQPLSALSRDEGKGIDGVLFDLDDTILTHGVLTRAAYDALWELHEARVHLVAVTGRPSAWGTVLVTQWPIDAATTENGAMIIVRDGRRVSHIDRCGSEERQVRRAKLGALVRDVKERAEELKLTDDAQGRVTDVTWDIGENEHVASERVAIVRSIIAEHGARSSCSSVHLHATFDTDDKATGTMRLLTTRFGADATTARTRWAFVGDSGNDRACFAAFSTTFGVANVQASLSALSVPPRYVSQASMGSGFAEIAHALLRCRMA